jgi:outer membrane immunogenic protein
MNRLLLGTVALASVSTPAFAADLPVLVPFPVAAPVAYNWTGCYIGGNVGGEWANTSGSGNFGPFPLPLLTSSTSFDFRGGGSSFIGGGQLGCNYQTGQFVFGIEGDADWKHLSRTGNFVSAPKPPIPLSFADDTADGSLSLTSNWQDSLRARLGYATGPILWYATGGVAFTKVSVSGHSIFRTSENDFDAAPVDIVPISKTVVGGTAGAGFEYALGPQVTLGFEARYTWYGSQNFNTVATDVNTPFTISPNLNTAEIMGKVNWRFGGGEEPTREERERRQWR